MSVSLFNINEAKKKILANIKNDFLKSKETTKCSVFISKSGLDNLKSQINLWKSSNFTGDNGLDTLINKKETEFKNETEKDSFTENNKIKILQTKNDWLIEVAEDSKNAKIKFEKTNYKSNVEGGDKVKLITVGITKNNYDETNGSNPMMTFEEKYDRYDIETVDDGINTMPVVVKGLKDNLINKIQEVYKLYNSSLVEAIKKSRESQITETQKFNSDILEHMNELKVVFGEGLNINELVGGVEEVSKIDGVESKDNEEVKKIQDKVLKKINDLELSDFEFQQDILANILSDMERNEEKFIKKKTDSSKWSSVVTELQKEADGNVKNLKSLKEDLLNNLDIIQTEQVNIEGKINGVTSKISQSLRFFKISLGEFSNLLESELNQITSDKNIKIQNIVNSFFDKVRDAQKKRNDSILNAQNEFNLLKKNKENELRKQIQEINKSLKTRQDQRKKDFGSVRKDLESKKKRIELYKDPFILSTEINAKYFSGNYMGRGEYQDVKIIKVISMMTTMHPMDGEPAFELSNGKKVTLSSSCEYVGNDVPVKIEAKGGALNEEYTNLTFQL